MNTIRTEDTFLYNGLGITAVLVSPLLLLTRRCFKFTIIKNSQYFLDALRDLFSPPYLNVVSHISHKIYIFVILSHHQYANNPLFTKDMLPHEKKNLKELLLKKKPGKNRRKETDRQ